MPDIMTTSAREDGRARAAAFVTDRG